MNDEGKKFGPYDEVKILKNGDVKVAFTDEVDGHATWGVGILADVSQVAYSHKKQQPSYEDCHFLIRGE